jgi:hypothetical protein
MRTPRRQRVRHHSAYVPVCVAADLTGVPVATVERWLSEGRVYSERIRGGTYVSLDDVTNLASEAGPEGGDG